MAFRHIPILCREVADLLLCRPGGIYVDCTVGGGGHASDLLERSAPDGRLIGVDRDPEALRAAGEALRGYGGRVTLVRSDYKRLAEILSELGVERVDGILADLGVSSYQLDTAERGFSFQREGPLDMRMDPESGESAAEMIERLSVGALERIIREYGEERWARAIARGIKEAGTLKTTRELASVIERIVPRRFHPPGTHVATRTFQALRIAVNEELEGLNDFIVTAVGRLKPGGRMAVISFHSLEDRVVKQVFRGLSRGCICPPDLPVCRCGVEAVARVITRRPVDPSPEEVAANPRSRSARLRVAERL